MRSLLIAMICVLGVGRAEALDISGVLPTSIGLPEVNVVLRTGAGAAPYSGQDSFGFPLTNLRMVYDTGASGVVLFEGPADALSIPIAQFGGEDVVFTDVGVGGSTTFDVSDDRHMSLGNFVQDPPNPYTMDSDYPRQVPDLRLQLGPPGSAVPFLADITLLGIVGMPAFAGRVSVINPKLAEVSFFELTPADTIRTYVYDPPLPPESGPGIPAVDVHVELTLRSFDRFTQTTPAGAVGPTLNENPFVGPDPLAALEGVSPLPTTPPGITVSLGGSRATGTFLLDTGAQISSISSAIALALGVRHWAPGDPGYDAGLPPMLVFDADGSLVPDQFDVTLGGIGGTTTIAGFYVDSLLVRTMEGDPLVDADPNHLNFVSAPVFVQDIELMDPGTMDTFVFDGILGTNFLFGSGDLSALAGFEVPFRPGPFEWLVLDFDSGTPTLGLSLAAAPVPLSPGVGLAVALLLAALGTRWAAGRER
ncbi:MAG: hypothetical protein QNK04_25505 [Myxococcota bacterium]|nr:hypothetical protein [Myxococcota bacterium]